MPLALVIVQYVSAVALAVGVLVGVVQLRQHSVRRRREAMLELLHSFQTPDMTSALTLVIRRSRELSPHDFREFVRGEARGPMSHVCVNFQAIGASVYAGELDLDLVRAVFGEAITRAWAALRATIEDTRQQQGWPRLYEWFQWLAERIEERETSAPREPAYVAFKNWKSPAGGRAG